MIIEPLSGTVLVKPMSESKSSGGIVLPANLKESYSKGQIVNPGGGRILDSGERMNPQTKAGDVVYFIDRSTLKINVDGTNYLIMDELNVVAIVKE